jgi:SAM-dependent methyltransferase
MQPTFVDYKQVTRPEGLEVKPMNLIRRVASRAQQILRNRSERSRLRRILNAASNPLARPDKVFAGVEDDYWLWLNTEGYRQHPELRAILPAMPDEDVQLNYNGAKGDDVLRAGFLTYKMIKDLYVKYRGSFATCGSILDFGCGWGRVMRFFLKDKEPSRLLGIDCSDKMIEFCRQTNRWCQFELVDPVPPTIFPSEQFDLIHAFSVFSHLSEEVHLQWLAEFRRILKPGGIVIATTRHRDFIQYCDDLRKDANLESYPIGLKISARSFPDKDQSLADYDSGKYCFTPHYTEGLLMSNHTEGMLRFFGDTAISKSYVLSQWTKYSTFLEYIDDVQLCGQCVIVVKK